LGIQIKTFTPYVAKLQTTLEREMDFFYEVETIDGEYFLLHLEFQTEDEFDMVYRNAEYHGIALNLRKMEIRHIVVYLGVNKPMMPTQLPLKQVYRGFDLINIHSFDHNKLLQSQVPDVIILAVLADYPPEKAESILRLIMRQLRVVCQNPSELSKYIRQLVVLSRLRKIDDLTIKITEDMPITYDIETDYLYKKGTERGIEKGIEKGIERGIEKGIEIEKIEVICNARIKGLSIDDIADIVKLPLEKVQQILKKMNIK
jgi:predicted transposase YdaD